MLPTTSTRPGKKAWIPNVARAPTTLYGHKIFLHDNKSNSDMMRSRMKNEPAQQKMLSKKKLEKKQLINDDDGFLIH